MLTVVEKAVFLSSVDLFREVTTEQLSILATIAEEVEFPAGTVILQEGGPGEALYLITEGRVEVRRGEHLVGVHGAREPIGALSLLDHKPNIISAQTLENTRALKIRGEDFYDLLSDYIEIARGIFTFLASQVRELLAEQKVGVGAPGPLASREPDGPTP